jgi:hypothetical protein
MYRRIVRTSTCMRRASSEPLIRLCACSNSWPERGSWVADTWKKFSRKSGRLLSWFARIVAADTTSPQSGGGASDLRLPEDVDQAVENAVREGATVSMPVEDTFWNTRYGRLRDPFGTSGRWARDCRRSNGACS